MVMNGPYFEQDGPQLDHLALGQRADGSYARPVPASTGGIQKVPSRHQCPPRAVENVRGHNE